MSDFPKVSEEEKLIARFLETRFGSRPRFFVHRDSPDDPMYVAIGIAENYPAGGLSTCATNGVSNQPIYDLAT